MMFDEWWDNETANVGRKSLGRGGMFYNFAKRAWEALEADNAQMLAREALACEAYNGVEKEIAKLREELAATKKNDERWQWLRENGVYLIECVIERRGYRSTAVDAQWEVWHERDGWITSAHHNYQEPFRTMDDAVDDAMRKEQQS